MEKTVSIGRVYSPENFAVETFYGGFKKIECLRIHLKHKFEKEKDRKFRIEIFIEKPDYIQYIVANFQHHTSHLSGKFS